MNVYNLRIKGESSNYYDINIRLNGLKAEVNCSCEAGTIHKTCKHRAAILAGDFSNVVDNNNQDLNTIISQIKNTKIGKALDGINAMKSSMENLQAKLKNQKSDLTKSMIDLKSQLPHE